jgi:sterol desaturase/sphingolipid hydroxylase (fatty acid hydroxylase superfamily)
MDLAAWTVSNEGAVRFAVFASIFAAMAAAEAALPANARLLPRATRWVANLGLGAISSALLRIVLPGAAVLAAVYAQMRGWGALNLTHWPLWVEVLIALVALDLAIYVQHVATHRIPLLWRLHQVHHADHEVDVTTALRFHPVEIVLSQVYKIGVVVLLGADPVAVIAFEIVLNACAMFNHANLRVPAPLDAMLRIALVTPAMHRIHHSQEPAETNSNFGFNLSVWDRIFGTYRRDARQPLAIGLEPYRNAPSADLVWTLMLPFRNRE